jgi:hypothetical protein
LISIDAENLGASEEHKRLAGQSQQLRDIGRFQKAPPHIVFHGRPQLETSVNRLLDSHLDCRAAFPEMPNAPRAAAIVPVQSPMRSGPRAAASSSSSDLVVPSPEPNIELQRPGWRRVLVEFGDREGERVQGV